MLRWLLPTLILVASCTTTVGGVENSSCPSISVLAEEEQPTSVGDSQLTFRSDEADGLDLSPGSVLISAVDSGFTRAVVSTTRSDGEVVVHTEDADLSTIDCNEKVGGKFDTNGTGDKEDGFSGYLRTGPVSLVLGSGSTLELEPYADLSSDLTFDGELGGDGFALVNWTLCPEGGIEFALDVSGGLSLFVIKNLLGYAYPWLVGPVPFTVSLSTGVGLWTAILGDLHASGDLNFSGCLQVATRWELGKAPQITTHADFDLELRDAEFEADGDAYFRLFLSAPSVSLCAFGALCTSVGLRFYVDVIRNEDSTFLFCGGIQGVLFLSAELPWSSSIKPGAFKFIGYPFVHTKLAGEGSCEEVDLDVPDLEDEPEPTELDEEDEGL